MTLPVPNLDDRHFQDLVDDARRYVQRRCPEWSDHNVSDPGITLIETYAMVVDQLIYRLNQVPDRLYLRFLELLGMPLYPPTPAVAPTTFWLSAPREDTVTVPAGTEVATQRTEAEPALSFTTTENLAILPCSLVGIATTVGEHGGQPVDRNRALSQDAPFECFSTTPEYGDALLIGLSVAAPRCAVALRFDCQVEGVGVDPRQPPLVWEAWTGNRWDFCELDRDGTGGLNRPGDVVVHVPAGHATSVIAQQPAGWLRCRVVPAAPGQPFYSASPRIHGASAFTVGATIDAAYSETIHNEVLGVSEAVPGQRFPLAHHPVVAGPEPLVVRVGAGDDRQEWHQVPHFAGSGAADRHFVLDLIGGEIVFGPGVRQPDGQVRQYGAIPPKGAAIKVPIYRVGGGRRGNVARGEITALRASVPYVARVENRRPASGGVDGEDVENAKRRAPQFLRARRRAVTIGDYESLACEADPRAARVKCITGQGADSAVVRLVVLPSLPGEPSEPVPFVALQPRPDVLATIATYLDERRVLGTRLLIEPPVYRWVRAVATVQLRPLADPGRVTQDALGALYRHLHPLRGGLDGSGWPFGRAVQAGELLAAVQRVTGVEAVEEMKLYLVDPGSSQPVEGSRLKVELEPDMLPFSIEHVVELANS
ncbi:MAG: putative baseplate assembly protein [Pseudonocardiaceae bacterium]